MTVLNTRRLVKSFLRVGEAKPKFSIVLANSTDKVEETLKKIYQTSFKDFPAMETYLRSKGVRFLTPPITFGADYKYTLTNKVLQIQFNLEKVDSEFDTVVVAMYVMNELHIFDLKAIDVNQLTESDGLEFLYHI